MGVIVGDMMSAIPIAATDVPATSSSAAPKKTGDGKPVAAGGDMTARQTLFMSAAYVIGAIVVLLAGARVFRDARIG